MADIRDAHMGPWRMAFFEANMHQNGHDADAAIYGLVAFDGRNVFLSVPSELSQLGHHVANADYRSLLTDFPFARIDRSTGLLLAVARLFLKTGRSKNLETCGFDALRTWIATVLRKEGGRGDNGDDVRLKIASILNSLAIEISYDQLPPSCSIRHQIAYNLPKTLKKTVIRPLRVSIAARIDIAGGWTDTPPITYALPESMVLNAAVKVDGRKPISCELFPLQEIRGFRVSLGDDGPVLEYTMATEIVLAAQRASEPGSLICAVLAVSGVVPGLLDGRKRVDFDSECRGLWIRCYSDLPHGSGLGTSSILSAAVLAGLWTMFGREFTNDDVVQAVLKVEQFHTTGGGWQDQVGGLYPGIKISVLSPKTNSIYVKQLNITDTFIDSINTRLALIFTGKTRLAKDLLQRVLLSYFRKHDKLIATFDDLITTTKSATEIFENGEFPVTEVTQYHESKKILATGAEPANVAELIADLKENNQIEAAWIAGAGGGGFLYVWMTEGITAKELRHYLAKDANYSGMSVHEIEVDMDPLIVEVL
uniref:GHMP_kinases_N domain-containing protein n=1 Tax=Panagrellus redivivus TaxID=6233 RepID=A0A7E4UWX7_PANRE